jgi:hypothetical protein
MATQQQQPYMYGYYPYYMPNQYNGYQQGYNQTYMKQQQQPYGQTAPFTAPATTSAKEGFPSDGGYPAYTAPYNSYEGHDYKPYPQQFQQPPQSAPSSGAPAAYAEQQKPFKVSVVDVATFVAR